ncbi:MAG: RNA polymerase sigma factor (sigma-70 family) [Flavobacteriales bacterium]
MIDTPLVEHFFRHEYGKLVAMLSRKVGVQHIEAVEDAVQAALMAALDTWTVKGQPNNPTAWLYTVAQNHLIGELRQTNSRIAILKRQQAPHIGSEQGSIDNLHETNINNIEQSIQAEYFLSNELNDDILRMLFVVCHKNIPLESQLVFALKTLCGFDVREISIRLFASEANIYKRLTRARAILKKMPRLLDDLNPTEYEQRLPAVHKILYLLFTEGYLSSHIEIAIRRELCEEALRLTTILAENIHGKNPKTYALLALMYFHMARLPARHSPNEGLLLLEEQDRSLWERWGIQVGLVWLEKSAKGNDFSRYHAEAGVAAEHCLSPSFNETQWQNIVECYTLLEHASPSPIHRLNRAVAVAEWKGPNAGLEVVSNFSAPDWLRESYQWNAVLADLHNRCKNTEFASTFRDKALASCPSLAVRTLLEKRLNFYVKIEPN